MAPHFNKAPESPCGKTDGFAAFMCFLKMYLCSKIALAITDTVEYSYKC